VNVIEGSQSHSDIQLAKENKTVCRSVNNVPAQPSVLKAARAIAYCNKTSSVLINITLRRVYDTIVAVAKE